MSDAPQSRSTDLSGLRELATTLDHWVEALRTKTIAELTVSDIALFNGGCISDDIESAAKALRSVAQATIPRGELTPYDNAAFQNTDDAEIVTILAAVRHCANSWDGSARLVGNVRAWDISRACTGAINALAYAVQVPEGYALVPRKITIAMIAAGWAAFRRDKPPVQLLGPGKGFVEAWEAMLDASSVPSTVLCTQDRPREGTSDIQNNLCSDCPPVGYPTDRTRCDPCPRRSTELTSTQSGGAVK